MQLLELEQGTPEWHAWRNARLPDGGPRIMASDLPAIMGDSPYETAHQLWMRLTGRSRPKPPNPAMRRGTDLEPVARKLACDRLGVNYKPVCVQAQPGDAAPEWAGCSLDGMAFPAMDSILEIKVPGKESIREVLDGVVPQKWRAQIQWQLLVTGVPKALLCVYTEDEQVCPGHIVLVDVQADASYQRTLIEAANRFRQAVIDDIPLSGDELSALSVHWLKAYEAFKQAEERFKAAQDRLLRAAPAGERVDTPCATITRALREGNIDYAALLAQIGVDEAQIAAYRKPPREVVTVRKAAGADEFVQEWEQALRQKAVQQSLDLGASMEQDSVPLLNW